MWIIVMFDLPTDTKLARRNYRIFRDRLLDEGFSMLQFSIYGRPCPSEEFAIARAGVIKAYLPDDGQVRILTLTDKQYGRMMVFCGKLRGLAESVPKQLEFF
jgi:CRISPR-associated protein Cas2